MSIEQKIAPSNSIVFVSDPTQSADIPIDPGLSLVSASRNCVCVGTLAEVDGETMIRLGSDFANPEGEIVFDGSIETPGHRLAVSDASAIEILAIDVPSSLTRLTIWANDPIEPDVILIRAR